MVATRSLALLTAGVVLGAALAWGLMGQGPWVWAANDRFQDSVLATGPVNVGPLSPDVDGVWLLDYRTGKLLGTVVNRATGRISGFAEADLVKEFGIPPRSPCHFLMTTGQIGPGQSVLYLVELVSGRFAVYSLALNPEGPVPGSVQIRRHDMVSFRPPSKPEPAP